MKIEIGWNAKCIEEVPFIAAKSGLSSQGKPEHWKVISFQRGVEGDSSRPLPGTGNALDSYSSGQLGGDNIHTLSICLTQAYPHIVHLLLR